MQYYLCKESECQHLCYHMYHCDNECYDYSNRHICKHIHCVHSMRLSLQADDHTENCTVTNPAMQFSSETESESDPLEFAESIRKEQVIHNNY